MICYFISDQTITLLRSDLSQIISVKFKPLSDSLFIGLTPEGRKD